MEKKIKSILFLLLIIVLAIVSNVILGLNSVALSHFKEGFVESYDMCMNQLYPQWFCFRTPIQSSKEIGFCHCGNGQMGTFQFDGKCYCYPNNPTFPYYAENKFFDYPGNDKY